MNVVTATLVATIAVSAPAAPKYERRIEVERAGPTRLDVDLPLIAGAAPRLADLRIFDRLGTEIPYLVIEPKPADTEWIRPGQFEISPAKTTTGIEADAGSAHSIDAVRLDQIAAPFLERIRIEGSRDRVRWTSLAEATVFDLPEQKLTHTTIEFAPVEVRYVRLTWDDASSGRIRAARVVLRTYGAAAPPMPFRSPVPIQKRPSEPGRSRYRIQLPAAALPVRTIELTVPKGDVFRHAVVTEPRLTGNEIVPFALGEGQLRQVERNGLIAAETRIAITSPKSAELDVVIDDGNDAPLTISRAIAELQPQPWIYLEAPSAGTLTARYGDATMDAPRYDLAALRPLIARAGVQRGEWETPRPIRSPQGHRRAAAMPALGDPVDRARFAVTRRIAPAARGMSTLPLDADVLARSRDLADVRLLDSSGRQVPFIIERRGEPLMLSLSIGSRAGGKNVSQYAIKLPYATLPSGTRLALSAGTAVFQRQITLRETAEEQREPNVIATTWWRHADPGRKPPALMIDLPSRIDPDLQLLVNEPADAQLSITSVRLLMPAAALRFHHPGSPLTLVYGNPEASPPQYDLALLTPRLFREPAQEVFFATAVVPGTRDEGGFRLHFFWIAIAVVALALMLMLARLLAPLASSEHRAD